MHFVIFSINIKQNRTKIEINLRTGKYLYYISIGFIIEFIVLYGFKDVTLNWTTVP